MSDVVAAAAEQSAPKSTRAGRDVGRRILRSPLAMLGLVGTLLVLAAAVLAPWLSPHDPTSQNLAHILAPPIWAEGGTAEHLLGTDGLGRDVASRLLHGARNSLFVAVAAMLIGSGLGLVTGLVAGFFGGRVEALIMRLGDVQLAFPFILLAIAILGVVADRSALHLILVLGIPGWIIYARVVRSRVLAEREKEYVQAARAVGAGSWRRLFRYVFPSVWQVVPVIALLDVGFLIIMESTLAFLGLGLPPPSPTWGGILAEGRRNMVVSPWLPVLPGLAILVTVLSINLFGDGLAAVIDPRLRRGGMRRILPPSLTAASWHDPGTAARDESSPAWPVATGEGAPLLQVRDLRIDFPATESTVHAVRGIDFDLRRGETLGVVGESGSGKSVTATAILQLLDPPGRVSTGQILLDGEDLARASNRRMAQLRGRQLGMIFQNPAASLNPVLTIGYQMREALRQVTGCTRKEAAERSHRALLDVGIPDPARVARQYPFELSGGMNQRVMIAMALAASPRVLLADEPTTALDTTTQAQILRRLVDLTEEHEISLVLITHDIAVVAEYADTVMVLYAGEVCEYGPVRQVVDDPRHPYTRALLESVPRVETADERLVPIPGDLPDPRAQRTGCPFAARCPEVMDVCREVKPPRFDIGGRHDAACHLWAPDRVAGSKP
ncbi:MAG: dipeptide/oligopeptide/nickel ABC transporter permease/ATP-binding protein [Actinobacteria bacterium]|nr:dipeptide/oligopeptide/nickel ABC transporter permease/ATP-binding protein [Actinomycetota bacterium]